MKDKKKNMHCWRMECWVRKVVLVNWRVEVGQAVEVRQMKKKAYMRCWCLESSGYRHS